MPINNSLFRFCFLLVGLCVSALAFADSMRCSGYIIEDGLSNRHTKYEILKKCGEPSVRHGNVWIYDADSRFPKKVRFRPDGTLISIRD
jgi:hypothetical protein